MGDHIRLNVTQAGAKVEYDCAFGTIDEPLLLEKDGTFEAHGIHVYERGGPIRLGEPPLDGWESNAPQRDFARDGKSCGHLFAGFGAPITA